MAENKNKPMTFAERMAKAAEENKKLSESDYIPTMGNSQPVEQRSETPEERETYARLMRLNDYGASAFELEQAKLDSYKEKMGESAARVAEMESKLQPQKHDPLKVDANRIMQQNIAQRAAEKVVKDPTSVEGVADKSEEASMVFGGYKPYVLRPELEKTLKMQSLFDSTDPLYESQGLKAAFKYLDTLPVNEEGKIVVDGVPYSRMELAQGLAPQMVAANSGSLWANNANYREDWAVSMGYKNMDAYLSALDLKLKDLQDKLAEQTWSEYDRYASPYSEVSQIQFGLVNNDASGAKEIRKIRDQIEGLRKDPTKWNELTSGFAESFDVNNFLTLGTTGLVSEFNKLSLYNKIKNGESLTPKEQILRDALDINNNIAAMQEARNYSGWHTLGQGLGFTVEAAPQFLLPMAISKALFTPLNLGVKGAWHLTMKAAMKEGFKGAVKTGLASTAKVGYKGLENIARFQINGMATAPLQASTYTRFLEKRNAQYSIKDGKVTYKPTDAWRDLVDTWIEQGAEVGSELFGVSLEKFMSASLADIGRNIGLGKMMRKIGGSIRDVETPKAVRFVKSGATKAGQQLLGYAGGIVPESLSEIYGDITGEMFKSVLTGNGSLEELKNPTYWATAFAISGIYGGGMSLLPGIADYVSYMHDMSALGKTKKKALEGIKHTELKNKLIALSAGGSIEEATRDLANLDWQSFDKVWVGHAMDYVRAEAMQQVRMGEATESERLQRFGKVAESIEAHAYKGADGKPSDTIIMATDKNGNSYHILEGDISNSESTLKAMDSEGKVVPLHASNVNSYSKASVAQVTQFYYQEMFSNEFNMERLAMAQSAIDRMTNPTMADIANVAKRVGIVMPKEGDTITLVDGRTAKVASISDELGIMAEMTDGEGNASLVSIPVMQIMSSNTYIAEAQKLQNAEDALELAQAEEAQAEAEDAVEEGDATTEVATEEESNGIIGTEVTLPDGNKGTIVEVDGDDVVVDTGRGVDAYEVYSKEELGMTEAEEMTTPQPAQTTAEQTTTETATEQTTGEVTPEQATEALNEIAGMEPMPTLEDGSIDYDAIDDAETFAKYFEHDMGSREEAIKGVQEMREQAVADLAEAEKKGKKARSANEKVANKQAREKLAGRIAFYDNVLDIYAPKAEVVTTPIENAPQVDTTSEAAPEQTSTTPTTEKKVGLIEDELTAQLDEEFRNLLDAVAIGLGVRVQFAPELYSVEGAPVDGLQRGDEVLLSWRNRENTLTWLLGHEMTHRMKALSPEAYKALRDAVKAYLGEAEWNKRIEVTKRNYEDKGVDILHGKRAKYKAEGLTDEEIDDIEREAYIEEVVCDEVGVLVQKDHAFDSFIHSEPVRSNSKLLNWLREVLQSMRNALKRSDYAKMMSALDNLIAEAKKEATEGADVDTNERISANTASVTPEVAEAAERIGNEGGVVDTQRGDVKFALADVLPVAEREQAIQDLIRVTGRSRATVQKYLKAEQSLARIIADDDNRAFLDLQVDESVPSIWNNSDYPQGTVEFSNICRKRLPLTMIYQQLQKEFPNTVFDASTLETIRGVLKENGIDVACGLCFVEDRRQLLGEIGNGFISALKGENVDVNEKQKEAIASLKDTYIPNLYELLTLDGMKALKKTHPEVANAFVAYNNARGMQAGRLFQAYSAYHREILGYSEARVNKINASGGLRIFSFSDFEAHHLIDLVQVLTDCARKGIKVQGYTKVPEFARAVKDTGMKLNRSLIAKGDGYVDADYSPKENEAVSPNVVDRKRLLLDCVEGIDVNHKDFFDSSSSHNVGNILVGINDEQIRLAMADPFVDYIIPFHSGLSEAIRKQKGIGNWQNYKLEQLEKKDNGSGKLVNADKHGVNIYTEVLSDDIKTEKQFVERYLEVCKEKGWVPKFHRFLKKDKNGDFVYTKGYYKLLLDFKMFDSKGRILPQEVVQPIFDDAFNKEILEDYVKGEKAKMPNDEVYNKVKEALDLGGEKLSLIGEVGASALDKAEEATTRLDDLNIARQMEERGDSALDIRMATGWERGADGLWRYEIPDIQIKRPDEWMGMRNIRLKDVVSGAEELFEAYPELADIKIKKGRGKGGGSYTHENKTIELGVAHLKGWIDGLRNPSAYYSSYEEIEAGLLRQAEVLRSTLIHEIQHAIQRIEGFAQGGNSTMILDASARAKYDEMIESYNERVDKYNKMSVEEQRTTEGRDLVNRLGSQRKAIDMFWKLNSIGASGYKRLAGEVEARNVEKRAGMPMAERLATLVEETEDVAREDQIIILEGINGVAEMAKKMKGTADRNASEFGQPTTQKDSPSLSRFGAKLRKDFESAIGQLQKGITTNDKLGVHEFLYELDNALTGKPKVSKNESQYIHVGNGVTLRLSDHYSNAKSFDDANNNKDNFGIVIRAENENRKKSVFKKHPNVDYVEYVYYPDKLDKDRQLNILQGVVQFIKTKDFEQLPTPDDTHVSVDKSTVTQTLTTPNGDEADGTRYSLREESAPTRYSLQSGDMPFFNDNGDIITFDNTDITGEDYDAIELRSPMPTTPRTTEDIVRSYLSSRHNAAKARIRKESKTLRDAVKKQYNEEQIRRREGVNSRRTMAAKVDYIVGAPLETLPYEAQVHAKIAMGELSISWESLMKELGVKDGDKKSYRHITKGATATLDEVVHAWWEDINGYERGIDTQDLRNALIDVLMQAPTAKGALSILESTYDNALRNRDEALYDIDSEEQRLIAEEEVRYNEKMEALKDPARMSDYIRQYEQSVGFHEELTAIDGTLRKMDAELNAVRKRAERALMRMRASKEKQSASFKEVREAIAEGKRALLESLSTYEQLGFNKQEVRSLVDAVNKARSMADINKVRVKIENVILNVSIREKRRQMDQLLNLRLPSGELVETWVSKQIHEGKMTVADGKRILADMFRGTNANGVRVAKFVDDETARVMDFLRNNLVVPNHGGHYQDKVDADGNVVGREYVPSREVTEGADELMASNEKKMNELLEKKINGDITEEENIELMARQLYTPYLFAANARANVKEVRAEGEKLYEDIQRKKAEMGDAYTKEMRDADYAALEANSLHLVEAKTAYDEALTEYNETLGNVIMEGRDNLRMFREGKEAHKAEVVGMAIKAIGGEAKETSDGLTVKERLSRGVRKGVGATYWAFNTACREIDRFAPNGEGEFYNHFMGGWREASNDFFTRTQNHVLSVCEAVGRITGSGKDSRRALRKFIETADWTDVGKIRYKNRNGKWEETRLKVSNALFVLAMWDQAQYRDIMTKRGVTQEVIDGITAKIASIDEHYLDFKEWVVQEFLPTTRLEYNEVHKQVFGASMDNIKNYFPAKVVKGYTEEDLNRGEQLLPSTITGSIITRKSHSENIKYNQSFFSVLLNHLQNMDQWASFTPLVEDLTAVLSSPEFSRLANEYKPGIGEDKGGAGSLKQILRETGAIAVGSYTSKADDADAALRFLTGAWAASNITFRFSTALKQMSGLSAVFTSGVGMTQFYFAKNLFSSIGWAYKNSPMFKKRWGDGVAGNEALLEKYSNRTDLDLKRRKIEHLFDKAKEYLRLLTVNIGMLANRAVDAWVTAVTMRTVYDVTLREITGGKPNTATEEQKSYAMMKAEIFANETQQSSEGAYLSVPQTQRSVVTAAATVYMNAPFAAHRMRVQGVQDIYHWLNAGYREEINTRYGDGAARKAAAKGLGRLMAGISIDASFILMSRALGQGLWNLIIDWFDGTEDDDDEAEPISWKEIGLDIAIQIATGGYLWLSQIPSLAGGHRLSLAPSLTELYGGVMNFLGWNEYKLKEGDFSIDLYWWALGEIMFKYGLGVDPETMLNIARGIEGICRDKDPMAAMKFLNTPQSMVNIIAGPRRNNETAKEYVERRARLEVLFAQPKYSELYDENGKWIGKGKYDAIGGAKDYRLSKLLKEYSERQRAVVMSKELSRSEVERYKRIDEEYKKVVEPLGWKVGVEPKDDLVDKTGWKNIYPDGMRQEHYTNLKTIAKEAEALQNAQERWIGSDEGLAKLIRAEYERREQVIEGRRSSWKAKTVKEKISREKAKEKKANKNKKRQKR